MTISFGLALTVKLDHAEGDSMAPTFASGQWLVVLKPVGMTLFRQQYHTGDVVILENKAVMPGLQPGALLVKRVVGVPHQLIGITRTTVYRDGKPIREPYVKYPMDNRHYDYGGAPNGGALFTSPAFEYTTLLKAGEYYVLGDNRPVSADSRWFGPIRQSQLTGRVLATLPLNDHVLWQRVLARSWRYWPLGFAALWLGTLYWPDGRRWWRAHRK